MVKPLQANKNEKNIKLERYLKSLLPINSILSIKLNVLGTEVTRSGCRVTDYLGQSPNNPDVYLYAISDTNGDKLGYIQSTFCKDFTSINDPIATYRYVKFCTFDTTQSTEAEVTSTYFPENPIKILILGGPSGAGKTYLENYLVTNYPDSYSKIQQVTTRKPRNEDDPYLFVSKTIYASLEYKLIGKVKGTNKYNNFYGSLPLFDEGLINTIILSEEGYNDFSEYWINNPNVIVITAFVGADIDGNVSFETREDRDQNLINEELQLESKFMFNAYRDLPKNEESINIINDNIRNLFNRRFRLQ